MIKYFHIFATSPSLEPVTIPVLNSLLVIFHKALEARVCVDMLTDVSIAFLFNLSSDLFTIEFKSRFSVSARVFRCLSIKSLIFVLQNI